MTHFEKYRSFVKNAYNMLYYSASFRVASLNNVKKCTIMSKNGVQSNKNNLDQRHLRHLSVTQLKHLNAECKAVLALIQRSQPNLISGFRAFHTSAPKHDKNVNEPRNDPNKKPNDDDKMGSVVAKAILWMLTGYIFITVLSMLFPGRQEQEHTLRYVSWNEFVYQMLAKGEVERVIVRPEIEHVTIVLYEGAIIKGRRIDHRTFQMSVVDVNKFEDKLRDAERMLGVKDEVPVIFERGADITGKLLISLFFAIFLLSFLSRSSGFKPPISMDTFTQMGRARFTLVDPVTVGGKGVYFKDVAGLHEAKQEVMEFVEYLKNPERYRRLGAKAQLYIRDIKFMVPKGALLLGPPGCGKTLLAKAVATEAKVPFLSMNGSEFIEMIGGLGAARVRDLFKEGAKRSPCIIYIDEIDAIGRQRGGGGAGGGGAQTASGESEQTLNQLLVEMDGMATKEGVLMLASTNRADVLDKALLRPGRFDRHILIDFPNLSERTEIFAYHLSSIVLENPAKTYAKRLAIMTPGFSGADIANVCNEAALHAARFKATKVRGTDLEYAVERVVGGTEKRSHALSPGERRTVAYHEAGHALVGWLLEHTDALLKVTIVPRTTMALGFAMYTPNDQKLYSKEQLFERMCMALGGRVAESLTFNKITTGAQNDLEKVTKMAYAQIRQYGMSDAVGLISFTDDEVSNKNKKPYSKVLAALMDAEVRLMVTQAYLKTESVLKENSDKLKLLAETLLKEETLNYKDVEKLIGPPPHGPKQMIGPEEFAQENVEEHKLESKQ